MPASTLPGDPILATLGSSVREFVGSDGFRIDLLCRALELRAADLAALTGRETTSVARYIQQERFVQPEDKRTKQVLRELVQIVGLLRSMKMDSNAAAWLRTPLPSYDGKTPLEVVESGDGQDLIERLLALAVGESGG